MRTLFLRHGKLQSVYVRYQDMPFSVLCDLASGKIDPGVDQAATRDLLGHSVSSELMKDISVIVCAPSRRSRETAEILKEMIQSTQDRLVDIIILPALHEVIFYLDRLYAPSEQGVVMSDLNAAVLSGIIRGVDAESIQDVCVRVKICIEKCVSLHAETVCAISHDFFMNIVEYCFLNHFQIPENVSISLFQGLHHNKHGEGFLFDAEGKMTVLAAHA